MQNIEHLTIKEQSARGLKWITASEIGMRGLQFGVSIVLARLLGPSVFGVFGVCLIFFKMIGMIGDAGLGTLIIQREHLPSKMVNGVSMISILLSAVLCIGLFLSASCFERLFQYKGLTYILRVFSFIFLIEGFNIILRSIFLRDLRFPALAIIQLLSLTVGGSISVILAVNSMGIWSLIIGLYIENGLHVVLLIIFSNRKIRPSLDFVFLKEDVHFALKIILTRASYFLNSSLGAVLIGKFLGDQALGLYVVAYGVMDMPVQRISKNVGILSVATLSKFQSDTREFGNIYKVINRYFSLVIFALFVGLFVVAEEFVMVFYGVKWLGMVVPLQVLCFAGIFRSLLVVSSASLVALNRIGTELIISFIQGLLMLITVLVLLQFGLAIACFGLVLAHGIGYLAAQIVIASRLKQAWTGCLGHLYHAAVPAGGMIVAWLIIRWLLKGNITNLTFFAVNTIACGFVFIFIATTMDKTVFSQIRKFLLPKS
jgi:O-antigen/teichoic acid export membrane protein